MFSSKPDPYGALKTDIETRLDKAIEWRNKMGGSDVAPLVLGEYGVGRVRPAERDHDLVRAYYQFTTRACLNRYIAPIAWADAGAGCWFCITEIDGPGVKHVYGIADTIMKA